MSSRYAEASRYGDDGGREFYITKDGKEIGLTEILTDLQTLERRGGPATTPSRPRPIPTETVTIATLADVAGWLAKETGATSAAVLAYLQNRLEDETADIVPTYRILNFVRSSAGDGREAREQGKAMAALLSRALGDCSYITIR